MEAGPEILRLLHGHHPGCGRYAPEPPGPDHAGQLRAAGPVQSVGLCPEHPVPSAEHHPGAALLRIQRPHGQRAYPVRGEHHPVHQPHRHQ